MMSDPLRHHTHDASPFGGDRFGKLAERFARFFGTPRFIIGQTFLVMLWIAANTLLVHAGVAWDVYPFILLNLAFSTQAAYAAPLILLAQTRQADRDKAGTEADARHRQEIADMQQKILAAIHDKVNEETPGGTPRKEMRSRTRHRGVEDIVRVGDLIDSADKDGRPPDLSQVTPDLMDLFSALQQPVRDRPFYPPPPEASKPSAAELIESARRKREQLTF